MSRISYISGSYVPHDKAFIHIEDRGNQFADGVYEVIPVNFSSLIDLDLHLDRLENNLKTLSINFKYNRRILNFILKRLIFLNKISDGIIYIQISRGVAKREHALKKNIKPTIFITARNNKFNFKILEEGV
ncbi:MAG: D-alanine aminotransferase, partial [Alphaproteobacteria bacterium MarineAlpha2_Bin1]